MIESLNIAWKSTGKSTGKFKKMHSENKKSFLKEDTKHPKSVVLSENL